MVLLFAVLWFRPMCYVSIWISLFSYGPRFQCVLFNLKDKNTFYIPTPGLEDRDNPDPNRYFHTRNLHKQYFFGSLSYFYFLSTVILCITSDWCLFWSMVLVIYWKGSRVKLMRSKLPRKIPLYNVVDLWLLGKCEFLLYLYMSTFFSTNVMLLFICVCFKFVM